MATGSSKMTLWGPVFGIITAVSVFGWMVSGNPRILLSEVTKAGLMATAVGLAIAGLSRHRLRPLATCAIVAAVASLWFIP